MKKLFAVLLIIVLISSLCFAEENKITDSEKDYLGGWVMYFSNGSTVRHFTLTFLEDHTVYLHSFSFSNSILTANNTASGIWGEFSNSVLFTLAGNDMCGQIRDDGLLYIGEFGKTVFSGAFEKCQDLGYIFN